MDWIQLFSKSKEIFYTDFLLDFMCTLVIVIYLLRGRKNKALLYLPILASASLIQILISQYDILSHHKSILGKLANNNAIYFYLIVESTCCLLFLSQSVSSSLSKKIILASAIAFIIYAVYYWTLNCTMWKSLPFIQNIEGFLIIVPCLYYFYELLTHVSDKDLLFDPAFYVIAAMLVLFSAITPLFLFLNYLNKNYKPLADKLFMINNIAYILLFLSFLVAIFIDSRNRKSC